MMHMIMERSREVVAYNDGIVNIIHLLPEEMRERVNRERVEGALAGLTERERMAVEMRSGSPGMRRRRTKTWGRGSG
jgi:hypothetical protein